MTGNPLWNCPDCGAPCNTPRELRVHRAYEHAAARAWPFGSLTPGKYGLILADPPWNYETWSERGKGKSADRHYSCMSLAEIQALPVADLAAADCVLCMWATFPMLPHAIQTIAEWGFAYVAGGAWGKLGKAESGVDPEAVDGAPALSFGAGYWFRSAAEAFLLAKRGRPPIGSRAERNLILSPRREHSRKPDEMYGILERLAPDVPRLELFARQSAPDWDCWGNEIGKFAAQKQRSQHGGNNRGDSQSLP